ANSQKGTTQSKYIDSCINEEEGTLNLDFTVYTEETDKKLILKNNHVEGEIPELNGYAPTSVIYTGTTETNTTFNYNEETKTFTIDKTATEGDNGNITRTVPTTNSYEIKVTYPLEAYETLEKETVQLKIPVKTYYEGYNNTNTEFKNPYKSNEAQRTIVVNYQKYSKGFNLTVGKYIYNSTDYSSRYIISKRKPLRIYNGQSEEERYDIYTVMWTAYVGKTTEGITMKSVEADKFIKTNAEEESTEEIVSNVGIYFTGAGETLGEEGWIKVYDDNTGELLETFTKDNWNRYTEINPYEYKIPVKMIRIETSNVIEDNAYFYVYNIKEIDDELITRKYTKEEFDEIQYISSKLSGNIGETNVITFIHQAHYEEPTSVALISVNKSAISTQNIEKNIKIMIETKAEEVKNQVKWEDGTFLIKFPAEIIDIQVNNISINNSAVKIDNYEVIEQDGQIFIKIATNNVIAQSYTITIDADLSADPRVATTTKSIELYATNENGSDYYYNANDIYDVNNNLNWAEQVNYRTVNISMVSPNSLLTNQTASSYDEKGSTVISPKIADIKPKYAVIDQEKQTAQIGIQLINNYVGTISEVQILGKIPFKGNTYVISKTDLNSTFTTKMLNTGIQVPEELREIAKVYYSENENPTREINNETNNWKTADQVENWDNIKTFLIDLGNYVMPTRKELVFSYTVEIPNGLEFNQVSYSHHGVYFSLDTEQGKYKTQTESNRLGFRIAEKYDLELQKYQIGKDKKVQEATYSVTEIIQKEDGTEENGDVKTATTNTEGILKINNIYANKTYEIKETKTPDDYEKNEDVIRFISTVDKNGVLTLNKISGETREDLKITKNEGENYKVTVKVEDEA
ncbi:MAG: hypothetical protein HFJ48_03120, partial [Clostridia bacterium]|nr:hypothetical protein [Clostridia bacterium]